MVEIICPNCNFAKDVPREKIPPSAKWANCPRCKQRFELPPAAASFESGATDEGAPGSKGEGRRAASPWEDRSELGIWRGILMTFKAVLFSSESLFKNMRMTGGLKEPLAFGLLSGSMGVIFSVFWQFLISWSALASLGDRFFGWISMNILFLVIMVVAPVITVINMFVTGGILHLCLLITRGGRNGFEGTFRVVAYAQATQVLGFVPLIGSFAGWIWRLIVQIIGLREIHETTYTRVVMALLIPVALIVLLVAAVLISMFILL